MLISDFCGGTHTYLPTCTYTHAHIHIYTEFLRHGSCVSDADKLLYVVYMDSLNLNCLLLQMQKNFQCMQNSFVLLRKREMGMIS